MLPKRPRAALRIVLGAVRYYNGPMPFVPVKYPIAPHLGGATVPPPTAPALLRVTPIPNAGGTAAWQREANKASVLGRTSWRLIVGPTSVYQAGAWAEHYRQWLLSVKDARGEPAYEDVVCQVVPIAPNGAPGTVWPLWPYKDLRAVWQQEPSYQPALSQLVATRQGLTLQKVG